MSLKGFRLPPDEEVMIEEQEAERRHCRKMKMCKVQRHEKKYMYRQPFIPNMSSHSFIQQICVNHSLYASYLRKRWEYNKVQDKAPDLKTFYILVGKRWSEFKSMYSLVVY